jgi:hypothetical protein
MVAKPNLSLERKQKLQRKSLLDYNALNVNVDVW